jgi:hypothetical protein
MLDDGRLTDGEKGKLGYGIFHGSKVCTPDDVISGFFEENPAKFVK